ncbi:OsmC family protein [Wenyingzhuangia sp.]|uniref:OsmC family protein n=1 Tax=Wenyingzhuangia sp. TaxID=1964193 RepID=UPI0032193D3C
MKNEHAYNIKLVWKGITTIDKRNHLKYTRIYELSFDNKPNLMGSADAMFHGDKTLYNPEEMLLSALSACYMMSFFYLCGLKNIKIKSYTDTPTGLVKVNPNGSGQFENVSLQPKISIQSCDAKKVEEALAEAHDYCFIARSCNFKITHHSKITYND